MDALKYTAVFEKVEEGWTQARIAEIPGVITAAPNRDEAKELVRDALREYLASFMDSEIRLDELDDREQLIVDLVAVREPSEA